MDMTPQNAAQLSHPAREFLQNAVMSRGIGFTAPVMAVALAFWHFWEIQEYIFSDLAHATGLGQDLCAAIALAVYAISSV